MATSTRRALANSEPAVKPLETYDAQQGWRNLLPDWWELARRRFLSRNLIARDLKVRYKNSLLGVLWSLLNSLLMMVVFSLVLGALTPNGPAAMDPAYLLRHFVTALLVLIVGYGIINRTQDLFGESL